MKAEGVLLRKPFGPYLQDLILASHQAGYRACCSEVYLSAKRCSEAAQATAAVESQPTGWIAACCTKHRLAASLAATSEAKVR